MKTFYTSGGIGDAFIFVCRLFRVSKEKCIKIKHYTDHKIWQNTIRELYYHLLPGYIETEFTEKRHRDEWEDEVRSLPLTPYPEFKRQSLNHFKLPSEFVVLQTISGVRSHRHLPKSVINKVMKSKDSVVLLGTRRESEIKNTIDLRGRTNIREAVTILRDAEVFYGPQGFLSFIACSQRTPSNVYLMGKEDAKAVRIRIEKFKWREYLVKRRLK